MWPTALLLALIVATDLAAAKACSPRPSSPDAPGPPSATPPAADVFTTRDGVRFRVEIVAGNLQAPWSLAFAPEGRLFFTERAGRVRILTPGGTPQVALTLDDVYTQSEAGALGLALDPGFGSTRLVYVYYTAQSNRGPVNRVVRYREVGGVLAERAVILDNIPAGPIHDGGRLRFGPDGLLYVTTGDAGAASLGQDLASLAGKILRINTDGTTPRDNPFGSPVYSSGHRNPQGLDWHPATGDLWASEHGNIGNDEINVIDRGANYGWPQIEGSQAAGDLRAPIRWYTPALAPSGASFYRGTRFPAFANHLFVATLRGRHILRLRIDPASPRAVSAEEALLQERFGRIRDVISGPDGLLYFCTSNRDGRGTPVDNDDRIARLVPAG